MSEIQETDQRHPAVLWGEMLMGQTVLDRAHHRLGVVEAVATSASGRLRRIGVRASSRNRRIQFLSVEGAELHLDQIVLPIDASRLGRFKVPTDAQGHRHFGPIFDRRRRYPLRVS